MSAETRASNVLPPVDGKIVAITLDATSRVYDLGAIDLGGERVELGGTMTLRMISDVSFYYKFKDTNSMTVNEASADAAGATPTFQANAAVLAPANQYVDIVSWNRKQHRYLGIKGSAAGVVRIWVSSQKTSR